MFRSQFAPNYCIVQLCAKGLEPRKAKDDHFKSTLTSTTRRLRVEDGQDGKAPFVVTSELLLVLLALAVVVVTLEVPVTLVVLAAAVVVVVTLVVLAAAVVVVTLVASAAAVVVVLGDSATVVVVSEMVVVVVTGCLQAQTQYLALGKDPPTKRFTPQALLLTTSAHVLMLL